MATSVLGGVVMDGLVARLEAAQREYVRHYPGEMGSRQPIHVVYGGAHLFKADTAARLGALALRALEQYAPDPQVFAEALGVAPPLADSVHARVIAKLRREAVEDFRIDFEDGYGHRSDAEEDGHALQAAHEVALGLAAGALPPFIGVRIKSLSAELGPRALRTLELFLGALLRESGGKLPGNFVVTLPKVTSAAQVEVLVDAFAALESALGLPAEALKLELMVEATQTLLAPDGTSLLPALLGAARGRCVAAHFGTYDYTASCNIAASSQAMRHPACDFAKQMMQLAYAGTGIRLSDGATSVMPVGPHRAAKGAALTAEQEAENLRAVHAAWRLHAEDVRHSLAGGFYQGWDLHPAQLPSRYGAAYAFFLQGLPAASERLRNFVAKAAQASLLGDVFDDAATGQGLLNFFLRGVSCGALTEDEALATGLTLEELRGRSFLRILQKRGGVSSSLAQ